MRKYIKHQATITSVVLMTLLVFACKDSFLEVPPTGQLAGAQLSTKAGLEGSLIGAYSMLNGRGNRVASSSNWVWGSVLGGEANKGTNSGDFTTINPLQRFDTTPTNGEVGGTWGVKYEGIQRCNTVLRSLTTATPDVTDADKKRIAGEARFLRGHYYFELKRLYNNTPYVDESVDYGTGVEKVTNTADLWPKIEADLKYAADNLPETQSAAGRANKWAAVSYLAKAYLYQKKYAEAKTLFDQVIANGKTANGKKYGLVAKYAQIFNAENDNHEESVFAIQSAANTGSVNNANSDDDLNYPYNTGSSGPGNCCGFFQPSFELGNSFRTDANGLPLLDGSYNSDANALKTDFGLQSAQPFTIDAGNVDPRLDHSIGRRGIPYLDWQDHPGYDWIRDQAYAGPYSPKKFIYYKTQEGTLTDGSSWTRGYAAMNHTVIRYADVLLMAAECEIEVGSLETARKYVNMVRTRAANKASWVTKNGAPAANYVIGTYDAVWSDKALARTAVRFERKLELSGEGHRFFDLVRWGIAEPTINAYLTYEGKKLITALGSAKFTANKNEYLPIPQGQIDLQGADILKQNPGY
ncbi:MULTISPECIES: RagB/SusD family nutrient uptake outer membrane protein [unclassified Arcicella]|uniref:RagB/SusD family nutrient uptake outer membrane protein n=1 Tax=unclassified Arcicella TaxID=2644986 RepID=UPI00285AC1BF|nr:MULTISPECIES: RagB/SusD family nutrient uptake outer membrane protein [unclassified Arcicella]MDR6563904.1 tetratricopeptide (TPR) repeat protein [Arcicella sp. BE51]MDR6813657.1 tetratricopeptide (TPR) repeat protein [Arcicella sp. BE140]MDR6824962.1 tetratricopeptide (TPR) repeat protein [Arcicella sp. BE139]